MIDTQFLDAVGNAIGGKVPVALHIHGDGITNAALDITRRGFLDFATACGLSLLPSAREDFRVDRNTTAIFEMNQGVFKVDVLVQPEGGDEDFFGGIVVQLQRIKKDSLGWFDSIHFQDGGNYFAGPIGPEAYPVEGLRELLPDTVRPNPQPAAARPPIVTGPLGDDFEEMDTDTVIIQIARNGDLTDKPVASGLVNIYRIRSPLVGPIASHDFDGLNRYIVSAGHERESLDPNAATRLIGFFLCGQQLAIPPTPWQEFRYDSDYVRLYTIGFLPTTFGTANAAGGIAILAYFGKLYVYDTSEPAQGWLQVASASPISVGLELNGFGFNFTVTQSPPNKTTYACAGVNDDGPMSRFELTTTRAVDGLSYDGSIQPMFFTGAVTPPTVRSFSQQASWTVADYPAARPDGTPGGITPHEHEAMNGSISAQYTIATDPPAPDTFVGGLLNPSASRSMFYSSTMAFTQQPAIEYDFMIPPSGSPPLVVPQVELYTPGYTWNQTLNVLFQEPRMGSISKTYTRSQSYTTTIIPADGTPAGLPGHPQAELVTVGAPTASGVPDITLGGAIGAHAPSRFKYLAMDRHRKTVAMRTDTQRTGTWAATTTDAYITLAPSVPLWPNGTVTVAMGSASILAEVIRRSKAVTHTIGDLTTKFAGAVDNAGPYSSSGFSGLSYLVTVDDLSNWHVQGDGIDATEGYGSDPLDVRLKSFFHGRVGTPGSWSASYTVPNPPPSPISFTPAQYNALGDLNIIDWALDSNGIAVMDNVHKSEVDAATMYGFAFAEVIDARPIFDIVYADPRSGGYIAHLMWEAKKDGSGTAPVLPFIAAIVGNDDSSVPLVDVLNEWAKLIADSPQFPLITYDSRVFIRRESAQEVSLI